jgi:hypothetical protein
MYNTVSSPRRKQPITRLKPTKMMTVITETKQTATIIHDHCCQWLNAKTRTEGKKLYPIKLHEKCKVHPVTCHEGTVREQRYSYTLCLTSTLDMVGGQHHAPATKNKTVSTKQQHNPTFSLGNHHITRAESHKTKTHSTKHHIHKLSNSC